MNPYSQFYAIINKIGMSKEDVVGEFTQGRTESLRELSNTEFAELMKVLAQFNTIPPGDSMRKKMIGLAKSMNWGASAITIVPKLDDWLLKQKYKKTLMGHTESELRIMLSIFERHVYGDYLRALSK